MTQPEQLDLMESPRRDTSDRILSVATMLFDAVKRTPLSAREKLPAILRNNNFGLALYKTRTHAFLEITTKRQAQPERKADRVLAYRQIFTSISSGESAFIALDHSRIVRFGNLTIEGSHAFAIGSDLSMCVWNTHGATMVNGQKRSYAINLLYVVGFGKAIREEDAWQEFDTIIRVTLSDWAGDR